MDKKKLNNTSPLRHPLRLLAIFLPTAALIFGSFFLFHQIELNRKHTKHEQAAHEIISVASTSITRTLQWIVRDLRYLSDDTGMQQLLDDFNNKNFKNLETDWISFSNNKRTYDKIRWIDENGIERLRINFSKPSAFSVAKEDLQDKRGRYFFSDTFKLNASEIFVSPFDLNMERGAIEVPHKPTIRLGMPVFNSQGEKRGILLINYLATDLLNNFSRSFSSRKESGWLVNQNGYWLKGPKNEDAFGFMFDRSSSSIAAQYPQAWQIINSKESGQFLTDAGLWTFNTVHPLREGQKTSAQCLNEAQSCTDSSARYVWKSIYLLPTQEYNEGILAFNLKLIGGALLLLGLFLAGSWRVVRAHLLEKDVRENLEEIVEQRTHDILVANQNLIDSQARERSLFRAIPDIIWLKDKEGVYLACNPAFESLLNATESNIVGKTAHEFLGDEVTEAFHSNDLEIIEENQSQRLEEWFTFVNKSEKFLFEVIKVPIQTPDGDLIGVLGVGRDITERKKAEEAMQLSDTVYKHSSQSIMVTDSDGLIIAVNPGFERITGYSASEVIGKNPNIVSSGRHDKQFFQAMWQSLNTLGRWQGEVWNRRKDGQIYPAWIVINAIFNESGEIERYVELCSDFTKKKEAEHLLWQQTNFDPLTGMPNRHMFTEDLEQKIKNAEANKRSLALLFLDIDHFKDVNDTLGHDMGNVLIKEAAIRIKDCIRESDVAAHLGGDDFTVILDSLANVNLIEQTANALLDALSEPFQLGEDVVHVTASIGVSIYPEDAKNADNALKNAEQAMYIAKKNGRNRCNYFTTSMQAAAQIRLRLINDLRMAVTENQFQVVYQPIANIQTGEIHKAEALIRWNHPTRGLISPAEFIGLAEEIDIIADLGNWIFHEAAHQSLRWRNALSPDFQVSINMSPLQFKNDGISHISWFDYLRRLGIPGAGIVVEITEGMLMDLDNSISAQLLAFRDASIQVAIDDFGTGYSSLSYLKKFDIDYLKIDQSFVRHLTPESSDLALCEAIIVMAHRLDIKVIAEGVETETQRKLLANANCDFGQGMLFSKPLNASDFEALLTENIRIHQKPDA